jgi:hypothetical protein
LEGLGDRSLAARHRETSWSTTKLFAPAKSPRLTLREPDAAFRRPLKVLRTTSAHTTIITTTNQVLVSANMAIPRKKTYQYVMTADECQLFNHLRRLEKDSIEIFTLEDHPRLYG